MQLRGIERQGQAPQDLQSISAVVLGGELGVQRWKIGNRGRGREEATSPSKEKAEFLRLFVNR